MNVGIRVAFCENFACTPGIKSFSLKFLNAKSPYPIITGEKSHKCDICEKSFARKGSLNEHMLVHTGEKPHTCDIFEK